MFPILFNVQNSFEFYPLDVKITMKLGKEYPNLSVEFGKCLLCGMPFNMFWSKTDQDLERVRQDVFQDHLQAVFSNYREEIAADGTRTVDSRPFYYVYCWKIRDILREGGMKDLRYWGEDD